MTGEREGTTGRKTGDLQGEKGSMTHEEQAEAIADYAATISATRAGLVKRIAEALASAARQGSERPQVTALEKAVVAYLSYLHGDMPLNAEFRLLKDRVVTAACSFIAPTDAALTAHGPQGHAPASEGQR